MEECECEVADGYCVMECALAVQRAGNISTVDTDDSDDGSDVLVQRFDHGDSGVVVTAVVATGVVTQLDTVTPTITPSNTPTASSAGNCAQISSSDATK